MKYFFSCIIALAVTGQCLLANAIPDEVSISARPFGQISYVNGKWESGIEVSNCLSGIFYNLSGNFNPVEGTVEFWFKPKIEMEEYLPTATLFHLQESIWEKQKAAIKVHVRNGKITAEVMLGKIKIKLEGQNLSWKGKEFHFITLTWGPDGVNFFMDGKLMAKTLQIKSFPKINYEMKLAGVVPNGFSGAVGIYDELKISDTQKSEDSIFNAYKGRIENNLDANTLLLASFNNNLDTKGLITKWKKEHPNIFIDVNKTKKIFFDTEKAFLILKSYNQSDQPVSMNVLYSIKGMNNDIFTEGSTILNAEKRRENIWQIPIKVPLITGYYHVKIRIKMEPKQKIKYLETDIAVVKDLSQVALDSSYLGLCMSGDAIITDSDFVHRLGFNWLRAHYVFHWKFIETKDRIYNWEYPDAVVKTGIDHKLLIMPYLHGDPPEWIKVVAGIPSGYGTKHRWIPDVPSKWREFVKIAVSRYKSEIPVWEIWNEPDWWMSGKTYFDFLKTSYQEIKKIDPSINVVTGGFVVAIKNKQYPYRDFIEEFVAQGGVDFCDIYGFHLYGGFKNFLKYSNMLRKDRERPVWITEYGIKKSKAPNEYQQLIMSIKTLLQPMEFGVERFFWFNYTDLLKETDGQWGLIDPSGRPRPIVVGLNYLLFRLNGYRFNKTMRDNEKNIVFVFSNSKKHDMYIAWNETSGSTCKFLTQKLSSTFKSFDCLGNPITKDEAAPKDIITLSTEPIFFTKE